MSEKKEHVSKSRLLQSKAELGVKQSAVVSDTAAAQSGTAVAVSRLFTQADEPLSSDPRSEERIPLNRLHIGMERLFEDVLREVPAVTEEVACKHGQDLKTVLWKMESVELKNLPYFEILVARVVAFCFRNRAADFARGTDSRTITPQEAREGIAEVLHLTFQSHGKWLVEYATSKNLWGHAD